MSYSKEDVAKQLKNAVEWLIDQDEGCVTIKLDDKLGICVGWLPGYGEEKRDDCIQSVSEPDFAINAGIKVYTSDDMRTDYEFINMPYYENGEVVQTDVSVIPNEDYVKLAEYLLNEYEGLKDLDIEDDGLIIEHEDEHEVEVPWGGTEHRELPSDYTKDESLKEDSEKSYVVRSFAYGRGRWFEVAECSTLEEAEKEFEEYLSSCKQENENTSFSQEYIVELRENSSEGKVIKSAQVTEKGKIIREGLSEVKKHMTFKDIEKLYKGKRYEFRGLDEYDEEEQPGLEEKVGQDCVITSAEILDAYEEYGFEYCYWNIKFDDGKEYYGVPGVALYDIDNYLYEDLNKEVNKLADELAEKFEKDYNVYYEVWADDDCIYIDISWGDWKHDHLWSSYITREFLKEKGYEVVSEDSNVTEEDGSDTYSAIHSFVVKKA